MKKLCELTMTKDNSSVEISTSRPVVVLFDKVLDPGKVIHSAEIDTFTNHFYGQSISATLGTDHHTNGR